MKPRVSVKTVAGSALSQRAGKTKTPTVEHSLSDSERKEAFRQARLMALANLAEMTPEEDAEITAAAEADPDNRPMTDEEFARAKPGRPPLLYPKEPITIRLDADVLRALRETGAGWQTRANGMLREALKLDAK